MLFTYNLKYFAQIPYYKVKFRIKNQKTNSIKAFNNMVIFFVKYLTCQL